MTTPNKKLDVKPATGKLGILTPGLGAVSSTFMVGVKAVMRGLGEPIGSLTQMGRIRLGKRTDNRNPLIKDFVPLTPLENIEFGAWDIFEDNCYQVAKKNHVIFGDMVDQLREDIEDIKPMRAVFDPAYVKKLNGTSIKEGKTKMDLAKQLMDDIAQFKEKKKVDRAVMVWCGSTEAYLKPSEVHQSIEAFEKGLKNNDPNIAPSMIYAYASIMSGVPYANGAPNLTVDTPAIQQLAKEKKVAISGRDFKTGQTFMKTVLAPGFKSRLLGINGWFSTNILGNRDGEVLEAPENFKTKEESKLSVLEHILQPELYPELYGKMHHQVRINYYPPRGDNKEGWDNIDIFGWLGYKMQIKVDFLCKDSILAAPLVLDLALFSDYAQRCGFSGIQEWLSFYY
ncbi:MAG TPA: inositol-3-phosphate synthase, partial [Candidatus Gracilibacteria bacterium]|nr:inositol-3-phosphate synthase [Candidatus Gracilibacteria bacterium]